MVTILRLRLLTCDSAVTIVKNLPLDCCGSLQEPGNSVKRLLLLHIGIKNKLEGIYVSTMCSSPSLELKISSNAPVSGPQVAVAAPTPGPRSISSKALS